MKKDESDRRILMETRDGMVRQAEEIEAELAECRKRIYALNAALDDWGNGSGKVISALIETGMLVHTKKRGKHDRGECSICGKETAITVDGFPYSHKTNKGGDCDGFRARAKRRKRAS